MALGAAYVFLSGLTLTNHVSTKSGFNMVLPCACVQAHGWSPKSHRTSNHFKQYSNISLTSLFRAEVPIHNVHQKDCGILTNACLRRVNPSDKRPYNRGYSPLLTFFKINFYQEHLLLKWKSSLWLWHWTQTVIKRSITANSRNFVVGLN